MADESAARHSHTLIAMPGGDLWNIQTSPVDLIIGGATF
jgi:hypothetical protein